MRPRRARWKKRCRRPAALAGEGWTSAWAPDPRGPGEVFLAAAYAHVRARSRMPMLSIRWRPNLIPWATDLLDGGARLARGLKRIADPLARLARLLRKKMDDKSANLEPYTRARLEAAARGLDRRAKRILPAWIQMLDTLAHGEVPDEFAPTGSLRACRRGR